jgi:hypothetical protein
MKARGIWVRLSCMIRAENASPRACGIFYKATVQLILLFGSQTWNLSPSSLKLLEGFHFRAALHMAGKRPVKLWDGTGMYPNLSQVLVDVGLKTVAHHIAVRLQHIVNYIVNKPIFTTCVEGGRSGGSNQWTWTQLGWHALGGPLLYLMTKGRITDVGSSPCR